MAIELFIELNKEWSRTVKGRAAAKALARWRRWEPALRRISNLDDILAISAGADRDTADSVLAALLSVGYEDPLAWRTVLQAVMPGLVRITRSFIPGPHPAEDTAAVVVAAAWQRIVEYPLDRRPKAIGANIVLDTRQRASRTLHSADPIEIPTDGIGRHLPPAYDVEDPAKTILGILCRAVHDNVVSLADARLVALTRINDVPINQLARRAGILPHSLRRRRLRVEALLAGIVV